MPTRPPADRDRADACPGVLSMHEAADGPLARVRVPGGLLSRPQWAALADAARRFGDGHLELTSRANVQLRSVADAAGLEWTLDAAGLLPSRSHERVRNILGSPLGDPDTVRELDAALCATAELTDLPGRFLFAVDDGSGDVAALGADVTLVAGGDLLLAGRSTGLPPEVPSALAAAAAFLAVRDGQWRMHELGERVADVAAAVGGRLGARASFPHRRMPVGAMPGGAVGALVPLGRIDATQAEAIAPTAARITPWRGLVFRESSLSTVDELGLITERDHPLAGVTSCAGKPHCAKALRDVRADAVNLLAPGSPVHWSGCSRHCGRPASALLVEATGQGYLVDGTATDSLADTVNLVHRRRESAS